MTHNSSSGLLPTSDGEELYFKAVINCQCDASELREELCCGSIDVGREQGPASTSFPQTERLLIRETLGTTCLPLGTRWIQAFYLRPRLLCPSPAVDVWESALSPAQCPQLVRGCAGDLQADISEPAGFSQWVGRCQAGDSKLQDYINEPWTEICEKSLGKSSPHGIGIGIPSPTRRSHGQATAACSGIGRDRLAQAATKSLPC